MDELQFDLIEASGEFLVCSLAPGTAIPEWIENARWVSVTRTEDEMSIICDAPNVPANVECHGPWRGLKVDADLDFETVEVAASLSSAIAAKAIPLLLVATYKTDYVFLQSRDYERACQALSDLGHNVIGTDKR